MRSFSAVARTLRRPGRRPSGEEFIRRRSACAPKHHARPAKVTPHAAKAIQTKTVVISSRNGSRNPNQILGADGVHAQGKDGRPAMLVRQRDPFLQVSPQPHGRRP
jgi:hypothetical protein